MAPGSCRNDAARASGTCWSCRKGLPRSEWRLGAAGKGLASFAGSFAGWQTAALNVLKRTLPGPQGLLELQERFAAA